ncbi:EAL domain-containing protein [Pseudoalteromonas sp. GB56]
MNAPDFLNRIDHISINLSGQSITSVQFVENTMKFLTRVNFPLNKLCFEVTETVAISNLESAANFISALKKYECTFSLDDFGSGLSSFGYLKNLPVDIVKIDGMFVRDILDDEIDNSIVKAINEVGHIMNMETVAEYVETDEIANKLKEIGVDYGQGYGLGKPRSLRDILS